MFGIINSLKNLFTKSNNNIVDDIIFPVNFGYDVENLIFDYKKDLEDTDLKLIVFHYRVTSPNFFNNSMINCKVGKSFVVKNTEFNFEELEDEYIEYLYQEYGGDIVISEECYTMFNIYINDVECFDDIIDYEDDSLVFNIDDYLEFIIVDFCELNCELINKKKLFPVSKNL